MSEISEKRFLPRAYPGLNWLLVGMAAVLVFLGSTDYFSDERTSRAIAKVARWLGGAELQAKVMRAHPVLRKAAHVVEYAVLAVLLIRALPAVAARRTTRWSWRVPLLSLGLTAAFAAGDEFHQRFVPSRSASVRDVMLDTSGAALGLCVALGAGCFWARRRDLPVSTWKST